MKPIVFAPQAPFKIAQRRLWSTWVERCVRQPDWIENDPTDPTVERRFAVIPEHDARVLRVAVRETEREFFVISAFFDRGARKRHAAKHL
ncbi:DUF4258 domain-containing protein [Brevundimonas staleyi]|uniref:DUF4258 domain-containing protein n=1 Tax=Brevundimonas staleyi TaxID=74326 RepID=A0ABW0FQS3_9CAUL